MSMRTATECCAPQAYASRYRTVSIFNVRCDRRYVESSLATGRGKAPFICLDGNPGGALMGTLGNTQIRSIIEKAWTDPAFRARLVADPKAALAEHGVPIEEAVSIEILVDTESISHIVIPQNTPINRRLVEHRHFPKWVFFADRAEHRESLGKVIEAAWDKPDFRERLIRSPVEALAEFGLTYPGRDIRVYANSESCWHVVLPIPSEI